MAFAMLAPMSRNSLAAPSPANSQSTRRASYFRDQSQNRESARHSRAHDLARRLFRLSGRPMGRRFLVLVFGSDSQQFMTAKKGGPSAGGATGAAFIKAARNTRDCLLVFAVSFCRGH